MQETVERSSIDIESNLYLLEDHFFSPLDDRNFLASIEEPRALEQLKAMSSTSSGTRTSAH